MGFVQEFQVAGSINEEVDIDYLEIFDKKLVIENLRKAICRMLMLFSQKGVVVSVKNKETVRIESSEKIQKKYEVPKLIETGKTANKINNNSRGQLKDGMGGWWVWGS
ncbi:MAG: hypothetical protein ACYDEJ_11105 [Desulfitobacteriaceae bacterium]